MCFDPSNSGLSLCRTSAADPAHAKGLGRGEHTPTRRSYRVRERAKRWRKKGLNG